MLIIKRYLSHFVGILTFIYLELLVNFTSYLFKESAIYVVFLFLSLWYLQRSKLKNIENKIAYFVLPLIFVSNVVSFLLYFDFSKIFLHIIVLLISVVMLLYLESFFLKHYFINFYGHHSFENIVENIIVITAFLLFVNFFSFRVSFNWHYASLFSVVALVLFLLFFAQFVFNNLLVSKKILSIIVSFLLFATFVSFEIDFRDQTFWLWSYAWVFISISLGVFILSCINFFANDFLTKNKILPILKTLREDNHDHKVLIYLIALPFLSLEILLASVFLPTNFYSLALINTIFLYIFILFSRYHLLEQFSLKMARRYLSLGFVILLFIFFITNWT